MGYSIKLEDLERFSLPLFVINEQHEILFANKSFCDLVGKRIDEVTGRKCYQMVHHLSSPHEACPLRHDEGKDGFLRAEFFEPSINRFIKAELFPIGEGRYLHLITDTTTSDHKSLTENIKDLAKALSLPYIVLRDDLTVKEFSEEASRLLKGRMRVGMSCDEFRCKSSICPKEALRFLKEGRVYHDVVEFEDDSEGCYLKRIIIPVSRDNDGFKEILIILNDLGDNRAHIDTNNRVKNLLDSVFNGMGDALVVVDRQFRLISANMGFLQMTGLSPEKVKGQHCYRISHGYHRPCFKEGEDCPVYKSFIDGRPHRSVHEHLSKTKESIYVEVNAYPLKNERGEVYASVETLRDITDIKRLEKESLELKIQLLQAQKMEAVGTLAAGIAHDFNNMLMGIAGYAEMISKNASNEEVRGYSEKILEIIKRASRLTEQILIIGRKKQYHKKALDLNRFISESVKTLRRMVEENILLDLRLKEPLPMVEVDEGQLYQVLLNLVVNARDELSERGGEIIITTGTRSLGELESIHTEKGEYVYFSVKDNGGGIPENLKSRIFEPFFTTKPQGKGTGLGLSVVYSIVKDHGGFVSVESKVGAGSEFFVYFPAVQGRLEEKEKQEPIPDEKINFSGKKVLVAEDEEVIRDLLYICLSEWGFDVTLAKSGDEAIRIFEQSHGDFQLVILDKVMPGISGLEAFRKMRERNSSLKGVLCTGYTSAELLDGAGKEVSVLKKPFKLDELKQTIRTVLGN